MMQWTMAHPWMTFWIAILVVMMIDDVFRIIGNTVVQTKQLENDTPEIKTEDDGNA